MAKLEVKDNCPLNNFEKCKQWDCAWYIQVRGKDPQTGQEIEDWGCAVAYLPMLLIENVRMSNQTGVAVESFRNEMVKDNAKLQSLFSDKEEGMLLETKKVNKGLLEAK
jgi:hypothetical protein|tara:strand:+ start:26 stop:352 length:327 start_codon:yes stop_codon:yes gene_type:complete